MCSLILFFSFAEEPMKDRAEFSHQKLQPYHVRSVFNSSENWSKVSSTNFRETFLPDCKFRLLSAWYLGEPTVWSCLFARDRENVNYNLAAVQEEFKCVALWDFWMNIFARFIGRFWRHVSRRTRCNVYFLSRTYITQYLDAARLPFLNEIYRKKSISLT